MLYMHIEWKQACHLIYVGQMKRSVNACKNFTTMMIKVKENNDDASKAFAGSDTKHKFDMFKIIWFFLLGCVIPS